MSHDPISLSFIAGCGTWVPVMIWTYMMISWMITGDLDVVAGFIGLALGAALGVFAIIQPNPSLTPLIFLGAMSTLVIFPFVKNARDKRELVKVDLEFIERAYDLLAERKDDIGARLRLAKTLYTRGAVGHAVTIGEQALAEMPKALFEEEVRMVHKWKSMSRPDDFRSVVCIRCGTTNEVGTIFCKRCGAKIMLDYARGAWISAELFRKIVACWGAAILCVIGIPMATTSLPSNLGLVVSIALVLMSAMLVWIAFARPSQGRA